MILAIACAFADPQAIARAEWERAPIADLIELRTEQDLGRWIRALGRSRDPAALTPLSALLQGEHGAAAAFGIGLLPNGAPTLRMLLKRPRTEREYGVRWMAIEGLGRQGGAQDVPRMIKELGAGWPWDEAAARGLLRLHRRGTDVAASVPSLARWSGDPRTEVAVAQTLARITTPGSVDRIWWTGQTSPARAGFLRATAGDGHDPKALRWALWDQPVVQIEALHAIRNARLDGFSEQVVERLRSPDGGVRFAAIEAAGALELTEALTLHLQDCQQLPAETAAVHRALKRGVEPGEQVDPGLAAVWVLQQQDKSALSSLARTGTHPWIRVAALTRLLELEPTDEELVQLLESPDSAVREGVIEALSHPTPAIVDELVFAVRVENAVGPLNTGLQRLLQWRRSDPHSVKPSRYLTSALKRAMSSRSTELRTTGTELAQALQLDLLPPPTPAEVRELILPDGTVTTTVGDLPQLKQVERIERALVYTTRGRFIIQLDTDNAPLAVHNFAALAASRFYESTLWHRVVPGFVAQGGCPRGDGWGGPGWTIVDEVSPRPFLDGAVGMARAGRDTAGSQFFVMTGPARFLEGDYTRFGDVVEGMSIVRALTPDDQILNIEFERSDAP